MASFCQQIVLLLVAFLAALFTIDGKTIDHKNKDGVDQLGQLLQVQILFRHTDRTPVSFYGTDPYKDYDWPEGIGALIEKGKERAYEFGEELKQRYSNAFLGK